MSNIDKRALREAAEKATPGRIGDRIDGSGSIKYRCVGYDGSLVLLTDHKNMEYGFVGDNGDADELFFRLCVPDVALALLDELEAAENNLIDSECHVAELEESLRDKQALLEAAEKHIAELRDWNLGLAQESLTHQQRIAELSGQKRLIGWRASDYTDETSDPELAKNWAAAIGVLPIFEGDVNTKLSTAGIGKGE